MRILLVKPFWPYPIAPGESTYNRIWPPSCLANGAALLEQEGHKAVILDAHAERISPKDISQYAKGFDKIFITSSTLDRWQCPNLNMDSFFQTAAALRKDYSELYIAGYHGTVSPGEMIRKTKARAVIRGEPEETILEICRGGTLAGIRGISYLEGERLVSTEDRPPLDLDKIPAPAIHLLDVNKYFYELVGERFWVFEGSRGCPYQCTFCSLVMYGGGLRKKTPQKFIQEIDKAVHEYKVKSGYFFDLNFTANKPLVEAICDHLIRKQYDFRWCCQTRVDLLDEGLLLKVKRAGCVLIHLGVETGSERILKDTNKGISREEITRTIRLIHHAGIQTLCFFLLGFADETAQDVKDTVRFAKKLNPTYVSFHQVTPYSGANENFLRSQGENPISPKIRAILRRATLGFYLRPGYILRTALNDGPLSLLKKVAFFLRYIGSR